MAPREGKDRLENCSGPIPSAREGAALQRGLQSLQGQEKKHHLLICT